MVPAVEKPTTMMVLMKYWPMFAFDQACDQFSKCRWVGSDSGWLRMSPELLKELHSAHSSGRPTIRAHTTRKMWLKAFSTPPSLERHFQRAAEGVDGSVLRGAEPGTSSIVSVVIAPPLELE